MTAGSFGPWDDPYGDLPYDEPAYGPKPYPTRGPTPREAPRPYPTRALGPRPYPTRDDRPYPTREDRPYPTRAADREHLDPAEWGDELSDRLLAHSAILRLGATLLAVDRPVVLPSLRFDATGSLVVRAKKDKDKLPLGYTKGVIASVDRLEPDANQIACRWIVPNWQIAEVARIPEPAWDDLGQGLAEEFDRRVLEALEGRFEAAGGANPREVIEAARAVGVPQASTGWLLPPATFDTISAAPALKEHTVDMTPLLVPRRWAEGERFYGYPYVVSTATQEQTYFSLDWGRVRIAANRRLVSVDIDAAAGRGETVLRFAVEFDVAVRDKVIVQAKLEAEK